MFVKYARARLHSGFVFGVSVMFFLKIKSHQKSIYVYIVFERGYNSSYVEEGVDTIKFAPLSLS